MNITITSVPCHASYKLYGLSAVLTFDIFEYVKSLNIYKYNYITFEITRLTPTPNSYKTLSVLTFLPSSCFLLVPFPGISYRISFYILSGSLAIFILLPSNNVRYINIISVASSRGIDGLIKYLLYLSCIQTSILVFEQFDA